MQPSAELTGQVLPKASKIPNTKSPVALDQACYDAVKNSNNPGKAALIERMDSRHAIHTVETAYEHGLGTRKYEIININKNCG